MTTTRTTATATATCTQCEGFDTIRPATCTAQYLPSRLGGPVGPTETLCSSCASNTRIYCNIKPLAAEGLTNAELLARPTTQVPAAIAPTPRPYADWFQALLDRNEICADYRAFERAAYSGHISYGISMTDGYYAPEDFDAWVIGFRKAPTGSLYWGNDRRNDLAPQVNSYTAIIAQITFLPDTPSYNTLRHTTTPKRISNGEPITIFPAKD